MSGESQAIVLPQMYTPARGDETVPMAKPKPNDREKLKRDQDLEEAFKKVDEFVERMGEGVDTTIEKLKTAKPKDLVRGTLRTFLTPYQWIKKGSDVVFGGGADIIQGGFRAVHSEERWRRGARRLAMGIEDNWRKEGAVGKEALRDITNAFGGVSDEEALNLLSKVKEGKLPEGYTKKGFAPLFFQNVIRTLLTNRAGATEEFLGIQEVQSALSGRGVKNVESFKLRLGQLNDNEQLQLIHALSDVVSRDQNFTQESTLKLVDLFGGVSPEQVRGILKSGLTILGFGPALNGVGVLLGVGGTVGGYVSLARGTELAVNLAEKGGQEMAESFRKSSAVHGRKTVMAGTAAGFLASYGVDKVIENPAVASVSLTLMQGLAQTVGTEPRRGFAGFVQGAVIAMNTYLMCRTAISSTQVAERLGAAGIHAVEATGENIAEQLDNLGNFFEEGADRAQAVVDKDRSVFYKAVGAFFRVTTDQEKSFEVSDVNAKGKENGEKLKFEPGSLTHKVRNKDGTELNVRYERKPEVEDNERGVAHKLARYAIEGQRESDGEPRTVDQVYGDTYKSLTRTISDFDLGTLPAEVYSIPKVNFEICQAFIKSHTDFDIEWTSNWQENERRIVVALEALNKDQDLSNDVNPDQIDTIAYNLARLNSPDTQTTYQRLIELAYSGNPPEGVIKGDQWNESFNLEGVSEPTVDVNVQELAENRGYAIGQLAGDIQAEHVDAGAAGYTKDQLNNLGTYADQIKRLEWDVSTDAGDIEAQLREDSIPDVVGLNDGIDGNEMSRADFARMIEILHENPNSYYLVKNQAGGATPEDLRVYREQGWVGERDEPVEEEMEPGVGEAVEVETVGTPTDREHSEGTYHPPQALPPAETLEPTVESTTQPTQESTTVPTETPIPTTTDVPPTQVPSATPPPATATPDVQWVEVPGTPTSRPEIRVPEWLVPVGAGLGAAMTATGGAGLAYLKREAIGQAVGQIPAFLRRLQKRRTVPLSAVKKSVAPPSALPSVEETRVPVVAEEINRGIDRVPSFSKGEEEAKRIVDSLWGWIGEIDDSGQLKSDLRQTINGTPPAEKQMIVDFIGQAEIEKRVNVLRSRDNLDASERVELGKLEDILNNYESTSMEELFNWIMITIYGYRFRAIVGR